MFKKIFVDLCNERRESPSAVCMKLGLSSATYSCWTDESVPRRATLQRMADYFGVSVERLKGEENGDALSDETIETISVFVRKHRGNLSLREFANKCGVSHTTIDNLERGVDPRTGKPPRIGLGTWQKIKSACEGARKEANMAKRTLTDIEVEQEIARLKQSPLVALGKQEQRLIYKRRQYMYQLRWLENRGRELAELGVTMENIEEQIARTDTALGDAESEKEV